MKDYYIDLHCHPSLKPFGKSFNKANRKRKNTTNRRRNNSIWHRKSPSLIRKVINIITSLTKFTQSDLTTVTTGNGKVIIASLYPMEKGMILDSNGVQFPGRLLRNLATGIGMKRIRHLQKMKDYFKDLEDEYNFYLQKNEAIVTIDRQKCRYKLVRNFEEILNDDSSIGIETIYVIMSIEGCHVFNCGLKLANKPIAVESDVIANIKKVKNWDYKPFFVGLAHHFYNEICGQAESLQGIVGNLIHQDDDKSQGITPLGFNVIDTLLDNRNNKRIHIDIKHMNVKSRNEYYQLLEEKYKNEDIPIIVSHGAISGKNNAIDNKTTGRRFTTGEINFFDDEIIRIEASSGVFGIQLDERRIIHKKDRGLFKNTNIGRKKMLRVRSKFVWKQIEHIAVTLDKENKNAWNIQCLGTDFDGIVDPLNGWWSARELGFLDSYLEIHATSFLKSNKGKSLKKKNKLRAEEIIAKFMYLNAEAFMHKNYK
jgi:microsomal dipeptidase-like Zn-dependent dipeptidase